MHAGIDIRLVRKKQGGVFHGFVRSLVWMAGLHGFVRHLRTTHRISQLLDGVKPQFCVFVIFVCQSVVSTRCGGWAGPAHGISGRVFPGRAAAPGWRTCHASALERELRAALLAPGRPEQPGRTGPFHAADRDSRHGDLGVSRRARTGRREPARGPAPHPPPSGPPAWRDRPGSPGPGPGATRCRCSSGR